MTKILSIIIPVYNNEKSIENCLNSILKQLNSGIEIIVVDDGSNDNTLNRLDKYKEKIRILHESNSGVGVARNFGLKHATGKYVWFIDADDEIKEGALNKKYLNNLLVNNFDVYLFGLEKVIDKKINIISNSKDSKLTKKQLKNKFAQIFSENLIIPVWNKIYLRKFLISNSITFTKFKLAEDAIFNYEVFSNINNLNVSTEVKYKYHLDSVTSSRYKFDKFFIINSNYRLKMLQKMLISLGVTDNWMIEKEIIDILWGEQANIFNYIRINKIGFCRGFNIYTNKMKSQEIQNLKRKVKFKQINNKKYFVKYFFVELPIVSYIYWWFNFKKY